MWPKAKVGVFASIAVGVASFAVPASAATSSSPPDRDDVGRATDVIHALTSLQSITPASIRKNLRARATIRQAMWTEEPGPKWDLDYHVTGAFFGALNPGSLRIRQAKPFEDNNPQAYYTLSFRINSNKVCIEVDYLKSLFSEKLTSPFERPYEFRDCEHNDCTKTRFSPLHLTYSGPSKVTTTFGFYVNNCLDEIVLSEARAVPAIDRERKAFEFITKTMDVPSAQSVLLSRGYSCDPRVIDGSQPGEKAFTCTATLPPNDDGFKSQGVEIWYDKDGRTIDGVLITR